MDALTTPSNWQRVRLGDIGITISGLVGKTKQDFINGNAKYITFLNVLNNVIIDTSILENVKIYPNEKQNSFKKYDLFFNTSSETPKEVGMCAVLLDDIDQVFLNSFCFGFRIFDKAVDSLFLSYLINSEIGRKAFENLAQGSTRYNLSKSGFNNVCLILPPLNEQIAIANILSDVDHYLCSLDALILKKESVKKALSFELLSQKKRLKGFNQAWQKVRLGDICEITTGSLDANEMVHYGKYRFYTCAKEYYFIDKYAFDTEAILISGNGAYVGYVHYYKGKFNAYQRTYVLDNFSEHIIFVKYFLTMFLQSHIQTNRNEGNTPYIVMATLKDFEILLPPLNEQAAIANILSGLDHEIISLKNKKRQFENIKKALNHDLMSAKIRVLKE
ncbi:restriction endonuclease subunit S [Helicobacter pylori]|uniref:restriction endonuclease subunit S n=1 Tax=Helicobacter pylori TaxID=210 RepID=UPI0009A2988E|nr:restriction endonuclease subunit S [Helicobacter pylori]NHA84563.1 restriction endonuclease subunit S [Helicobacter pylori]OPG37582.1 restriction endonuclease subunit S [Helicobacter pylori]